MPRLSARAFPEWIDPETLFRGGPAAATHAFWLDAGDDAGWSWMGIGTPDTPDPAALVCAAGKPSVDGGYDGAFRGGWVGWFGYDAAAAAAGAPADSGDPLPQSGWLRADRFVGFDHDARRVWAVAPAAELDAYVQTVVGWTRVPPSGASPALADAVIAQARDTPDAYAEMIEQCRAAIRAGDAYQLCLTTRFTAPGAHDPARVYLRLRRAQPSHHGLFLRRGPFALAGASPEQFLGIADGTVRTRPIKGTRPRSVSPEHDRALAEELAANVKERAENVMIVDLMRNDLQRVCEPGSVSAERLLEVETYPSVHQLVSTVAGRLRPGTTLREVLAATFPAGSMTGTPKLSAMSILHGLENEPRGVYAGCAGWIDDHGRADLAMVIRTVAFTPDTASVGAGGGITWLSDARDEVAEVAVKARGPLAALGALLPEDWGAAIDGMGERPVG